MSTAFVATVNPATMQQRRNRLIGVAAMNKSKKHAVISHGENMGFESMEVSPHKGENCFTKGKSKENGFNMKADCHAIVKQERPALSDINSNVPAERSFQVTGHKIKKEEKVVKHSARMHMPRAFQIGRVKAVHFSPGKKAKKVKGLKKEVRFDVTRPEPSAILDDDLLPMDVDMDINVKMRMVLTKAPTFIHSNPRLADHYSCPEYADDIYQYLQTVERRNSFPDNYLANDPEVTPHMRAILLDWLVQVQVHQELSQQTLHMTVALIDLFLSSQKVVLSTLQLLGITCLLIAAKYVERFPPEVGTLCHLTDNTYQPQQVLMMECIVLKQLKFDLNVMEPVSFMERFLQIETDMHDNKQFEHLCMYLMDLSITNHHFVHFVPSLMAASVVYLARKILGFRDAWTPALAFYTRYSEKELIKCSQMFAKYLMKAPSSKYQGARSKYASLSGFSGISNHPAVLNLDILKEAAGEETLIM